MDEEVLLDFNKAKTPKKTYYGISPCANGKYESPLRAKYKHALDSKKFNEPKNVSHILFFI